MNKRCVAHPDRPAGTMCHQCHKPVCTACTTVTPEGSYCGPECAVAHREMRARLRTKTGKPRSFAMTVVVVVLLLVVVAALIFVSRSGAFKPLVERLKRKAESTQK